MSTAARQRAGTPLTSDMTKRVNIHFRDRRKGMTQHGTVDLDNRMYQIGGQLSDFHFRIKGWYTMPLDVWTQLQQYAPYLNFIEWYDREGNQAFLVSYDDAVQYGQRYEAGIGPRWGVPTKLFAGPFRERL